MFYHFTVNFSGRPIEEGLKAVGRVFAAATNKPVNINPDQDDTDYLIIEIDGKIDKVWHKVSVSDWDLGNYNPKLWEIEIEGYVTE